MQIRKKEMRCCEIRRLLSQSKPILTANIIFFVSHNECNITIYIFRNEDIQGCYIDRAAEQ